MKETPFFINHENGWQRPEQIYNKPSDVGESTLKASKLLEVFWRLHILNRLNLVGVKVNSIGCKNESQEFTG